MAADPAIVDVATGNLILPIIGGPLDGCFLSWNPAEGGIRAFPDGPYSSGHFQISRYRGGWCWWWQEGVVRRG